MGRDRAMFGKAKRADTLDMTITKCKETSESVAMLAFFVMNLMKHVLDRIGFLTHHSGSPS